MATCIYCARREGETTVVADTSPARFGEPRRRWCWLDEKPPERLRARGQKGPLLPVWRDQQGALVACRGHRFGKVPEGPQSQNQVVLYQAIGGDWSGELVCELCLAGLDKWERYEATFTRRETQERAPVGQLALEGVG